MSNHRHCILLCSIIIVLLEAMAFLDNRNGVEASVPLNNFFPYGSGDGDAALSTNTWIYKIEPVLPFPFFNETMKSIWVNWRGRITFDGLYYDNRPDCHHGLQPRSSYVAPFWSYTYIAVVASYGILWYRETVSNSKVFAKAKEELASIFAQEGIADIKLRWALVATWDNVAWKDNKALRNTFQAVLTTDGRHSFAIFLYNDLQWSNGARVGYDLGHGDNYHIHEDSCTDQLKFKLITGSNVGKAGVWAYRLDTVPVRTTTTMKTTTTTTAAANVIIDDIDDGTLKHSADEDNANLIVGILWLLALIAIALAALLLFKRLCLSNQNAAAAPVVARLMSDETNHPPSQNPMKMSNLID